VNLLGNILDGNAGHAKTIRQPIRLSIDFEPLIPANLR
jgi:hypothetical protein